MSSAALSMNPAERSADIKRPSFASLTAVELRKSIDTRAGFWLLTGTALITLIVTVVVFFVGEGDDLTLGSYLSANIQPATFLLPVIGILLISSEWSQRTTLVTFLLVPDRRRVLLSKVAAGLTLGLIAALIALALSAPATALSSPDVDGTWSLSTAVLGQTLLYLELAMLSGLAFGAAFLSSPPAIVLYFVLPFVIGGLATIPALDSIGQWVDQSQAFGPLVDRKLDGEEWGHVGTTAALWVALPALIGWWRVRRDEIG